MVQHRLLRRLQRLLAGQTLQLTTQQSMVVLLILKKELLRIRILNMLKMLAEVLLLLVEQALLALQLRQQLAKAQI